MYKFNVEIQKKILSYLIFNKAKEILLIEPEYFDEIEAREIINTINHYYKNYYKFPEPEVIELELGKIFDENILPEHKKKIINYYKELLKNGNVLKKEDFENIFPVFLRYQKLRKLSLKINTDLIDGKVNIDEYIEALKKIKRIEENKEIKFENFIIYTKDIDIEYQSIKKIPTHLPTLNFWLEGGLGAGELGLLMAQTGLGKSYFLVNLAVASFKFKNVVLYISFELSAQLVKKRIDEVLFNVNIFDINKKEYLKKLNEMKTGGEIIIKYFPSESITVDELEEFIISLKEELNYNIDLLLVDYLDLLKPRYRTEYDWLDIGSVCKSLRALAQKLNIPVWTVSQISKSFYDREFGLEAVKRSTEKIQDSDLILGMFPDEKQENKLYLKVLKIRRTKKPNKTIEIIFDKSGLMKENNII